MGGNIYIFLLLLCGRIYCGFYDPKEIQDFNESADKDKELFKVRYYKLKAVNDEIVTKEIQNKELTAENQRISESVETARTESKELDKKNKVLKEENNRLIQSNSYLDSEKINKENEIKKHTELIKENIRFKESIETEIGTKEATLREVSREIETKVSVKENVQNAITVAESSLVMLKDEQVELNKEIKKAQNEMTELNKELETKVRLKENIQTDIEVKQAKEVELKIIIYDAQNDIEDLNKEKAEVVNRVCKEQYTLWNFEFLSNNKKSVFTSLLTTVLITALLPFVLKSFISSSPSTEIISPKRKIVNGNSQLRLEQLSDDEDSSGMVATSSGLLNRDLKYNYDRDTMERNEDPNRCFDHLRRKYGIRDNLKLHWHNLNPEECVKLNLWKVENGELTFTKLMVKKVIKTEKPLLTFELFQTRVNDGSLQVDCKETELAGDDSRIEAKLAMRIFNSLPEFSV
eukprot:GFUD01003230.1.p1 GENE.GFUD01003230.1~~GFUD01003230.1.p1  ORF type:complete len:463 (+),score=132.15 GFUD01003230.1:529-1917(+)